MATEDIKVVTIAQEFLQRVDKNNNYVVRLRVSNEDSSQKSAWSPYLAIPAKAIPATLPIAAAQMTASKSNDIVSLQWIATDTSYRPLYDVYVKWSTDSGATYGSYEFVDTVSSTFATVEFLDTANRLKFKVQVSGLVQEQNNNLLLGESNAITI
jgi:hypothetical protein